MPLFSLDDKLFAFWLLQGEGHVKGIFRFETGVKVGEFRDLRANPRSVHVAYVSCNTISYFIQVSVGITTHVDARTRWPLDSAAST